MRTEESSEHQLIVHYRRFYLYLGMIFFTILGDGIMSYYVPVIMERHFQSNTIMGLILGTSSIFGMFFDFFFAQKFGAKKSVFFNKIVFAFVFFFPISFFIYQSVPSFLFAMFVWGVYFEGIVFSNYHAIHEFVDHHHHAWAWGLLSIIRNIGWVIGPLMAIQLDKLNGRYPLYMALLLYFVAFLFFITRMVVQRFSHHRAIRPDAPAIRHSFTQEMKIWKVYGKTLWPLLAMLCLFFLIDATFFSIGTVFTESLALLSPLGALFISMYTIPSAIFPFLAAPISLIRGKKKAAYFFGVVTGIGLLAMSQVTSLWLILLTTFLASISIVIMVTELNATFEDFIARSGGFKNDVVGLTAIMGSIGYTVGPMIDGFLGDRIGIQRVFGMWGVILLVVSIFAFFRVKRKIKLPLQQIETIFVPAQ